jgi:phosphotransferase system HPr-like phosphotransfer protein
MSASSDHDVVVEEVAVLAADLHARPAGQVTRAATGVDARVWLTVEGRDEVDARSVLAVRGEGPQAAVAVAAVATVLRTADAASA